MQTRHAVVVRPPVTQVAAAGRVKTRHYRLPMPSWSRSTESLFPVIDICARRHLPPSSFAKLDSRLWAIVCFRLLVVECGTVCHPTSHPLEHYPFFVLVLQTYLFSKPTENLHAHQSQCPIKVGHLNIFYVSLNVRARGPSSKPSYGAQ